MITATRALEGLSGVLTELWDKFTDLQIDLKAEQAHNSDLEQEVDHLNDLVDELHSHRLALIRERNAEREAVLFAFRAFLRAEATESVTDPIAIKFAQEYVREQAEDSDQQAGTPPDDGYGGEPPANVGDIPF